MTDEIKLKELVTLALTEGFISNITLYDSHIEFMCEDTRFKLTKRAMEGFLTSILRHRRLSYRGLGFNNWPDNTGAGG